MSRPWMEGEREGREERKRSMSVALLHHYYPAMLPLDVQIVRMLIYYYLLIFLLPECLMLLRSPGKHRSLRESDVMI